MAGKEPKDEEPIEEAAPKKRSKLPLLIGLVVLLLVNSFIIGRLFLGGDKSGNRERRVEEVGVKVPLEEFLVNLAGSHDHYLKTTIALGLKKGLSEESVKEDIPPIRDAVLSVLTSKPLEELDSPEGKEKLKRELTDRINREVSGDKVVKVYFMAFATQ